MYVCQAPITQGLKKDIIIGHGEASPFFVSAKQGWTPYFALKGFSGGHGDAYWFTSEPSGTRGALYTDYDNEHDNVGLRPMPRMPDAVQEISREAIMFRPPPDALVLSARHAHTRNALLDRAVDRIASRSNRDPSDTRPIATVPLYISPHQLDEHVADAIGTQFLKLERICKLSYEREDVVDDLHGWRLLVHVRYDANRIA